MSDTHSLISKKKICLSKLEYLLGISKKCILKKWRLNDRLLCKSLVHQSSKHIKPEITILITCLFNCRHWKKFSCYVIVRREILIFDGQKLKKAKDKEIDCLFNSDFDRVDLYVSCRTRISVTLHVSLVACPKLDCL